MPKKRLRTADPKGPVMTMTAMETPVTTPSFSVHERCDRCGAQAFIRAVLATGDLLFCAHHGREFGKALAEVALHVEDGSAAINAKPSPSAY
jgi:hypothetical protein